MHVRSITKVRSAVLQSGDKITVSGIAKVAGVDRRTAKNALEYLIYNEPSLFVGKQIRSKKLGKKFPTSGKNWGKNSPLQEKTGEKIPQFEERANQEMGKKFPNLTGNGEKIPQFDWKWGKNSPISPTIWVFLNKYFSIYYYILELYTYLGLVQYISNNLFQNYILSGSDSLKQEQQAVAQSSSKAPSVQKIRERIQKKVRPVKKSKTDLQAEKIVDSWNSNARKIGGDKVPIHPNKKTKVYKKSVQLVKRLLTGSAVRLSFSQDWLQDKGLDPADLKVFKGKPEEVVKALKQLARLYHPDAWPPSKEWLPRSLPELIYNERTGKSWLLWVLRNGIFKSSEVTLKESENSTESEVLELYNKIKQEADRLRKVKMTDYEKLKLLHGMRKIVDWYYDEVYMTNKNLHQLAPTGEKFLAMFYRWVEPKPLNAWALEPWKTFNKDSDLFRRWLLQLAQEGLYVGEN